MPPPRKLVRAESALVLVDYQARLLPAIDGGEAALLEAVFLAQVAAALGVPVLGTEQHPAGLGPNDERVRSRCQRTLAKVHFDAAAEGLVEALRAARPGVRQVVLGGCEAHVCLLQTALGLQAAGLEVLVVPGACGSRRPGDQALAMQRLAQAGVALGSAEMVAYEWLEASTDPAFKQVLSLVKARPVR